MLALQQVRIAASMRAERHLETTIRRTDKHPIIESTLENWNEGIW